VCKSQHERWMMTIEEWTLTAVIRKRNES
jgi:hypothetical protein